MQLTKNITRSLADRFGLVGESPAMVQAMARLLQVAPTDITVLISGETGTGKEVFAHAFHDLSPRKKYPFVSVNCGAIPETLLESELFGAEKGAYTGADEKRKGFFEAADRGTIFLDEIGEMPISTQVKLLRILESGEFSRLGSSAVQKVDVRVVAATNRDLMYEVRQGRFRQDLYFRLNSVNVHLPPLRQHLDDIPLLVDYFAHRVADKNGLTYLGIDDQALRLLEGYPWPGNVRELRNVVETMVTLERGQHITADMALRYLPVQEDVTVDNSAALVRIGDPQPSASAADLQMLYRTMLQLAGDVNEMKTVLRHLLSITFDAQQPATPTTTAVAPTTKATVEEDLNLARIERTAIELALRKTHGSRRDAAKLLGISERTLYRKIDDYGLQ